MIKEQLNKPFPYIEKKTHRIVISLVFSLFIFLFLMIFQPFGLDDIQYYKPVLISGFFFITLIVLLFRFFASPIIFKKFHNPDNWTVKKNLITIFFIHLAIAIFNWIYNFLVGEEIVVQHNLFSFLFITISVGFFPTIILIILSEKYLSKKHNEIAENITNKIQLKEKISENKQIKIVSENKKEHISIELDQLICIKSEGNYASVYFYENENVKKQLIRNSLTKIKEQLIIFENIKRSHRSYIVNFNNVEKISGNARNYNLHIANLDFIIPVSRNFPKNIIDKYSE